MGVPGSANPLLLATAQDATYTVSRSLRFNAPDSAYLSRTPGSTSNRKMWTWAGWVKRSALTGADQFLFLCSTANTSPTTSWVSFNSSEKLTFGTSGNSRLITTQVFRDVSAWYHILLSVDTTQATAANRYKFYVNGVEVSAYDTASYVTQNTDTEINAASEHRIGRDFGSFTSYFSGYLAEIHFIDGQALTPSSFAETNATTGQWVPKTYTGSYGTNGFKLTFSDNSGTTSSTLGKDTSGNNNDWSPTNFSVAAGAGNDSLVDTPTSYGTDDGLGGSVKGNYATLNPLMTTSANSGGGLATLTNGNLEAQSTTSAYRNTYGTVAFPSSGKYYFEATLTTTNGQNNQSIGIASLSDTSKIFLLDCFATSTTTARKNVDTTFSGTYSTVGAGTVVQVAVDCDNGKAYLGFNNTWIDSSSPTGNTGGYSMATG